MLDVVSQFRQLAIPMHRKGPASVRGGRCDGGARRSGWFRITALRRDVGAEAHARGADGRWPVPGWV